MIILFLIFLVQFSVACASLALSDMQQKELFRVGWKAASSGLRETTQEIFQCCGMDLEHQNFTTTNSTAYPYFHPPCSKVNPWNKSFRWNVVYFSNIGWFVDWGWFGMLDIFNIEGFGDRGWFGMWCIRHIFTD